jgi:hypothetical protein
MHALVHSKAFEQLMSAGWVTKGGARIKLPMVEYEMLRADKFAQDHNMPKDAPMQNAYTDAAAQANMQSSSFGTTRVKPQLTHISRVSLSKAMAQQSKSSFQLRGPDQDRMTPHH